MTLIFGVFLRVQFEITYEYAHMIKAQSKTYGVDISPTGYLNCALLKRLERCVIAISS